MWQPNHEFTTERYPAGGIASSRHQIELYEYTRKKRAHRASTPRRAIRSGAMTTVGSIIASVFALVALRMG